VAGIVHQGHLDALVFAKSAFETGRCGQQLVDRGAFEVRPHGSMDVVKIGQVLLGRQAWDRGDLF
jgi:hypothetical protein